MTDLLGLHPRVFRFSASLSAEEGRVGFPFGLAESGVHEVCERQFGDMGAVTGFVLAHLQAGSNTIAWISQSGLSQDHGSLYSLAQKRMSSAPHRLLKIQTWRRSDTLWALEEIIASRLVGVVVAEVEAIDFTASRRLQLAAESSGIPAILIMPYSVEGTSASIARWRVASALSTPNVYDRAAPGAARWQVTLERCRAAPHVVGQSFRMEFDDETLSVRMVSGLAAHTPATHETRDIRLRKDVWGKTGS